MIETLETTIDDCVYSVTQMTARRAIRMQARLFRLLSSSIGHIVTSAQKNIDNAERSIPQALSLLAENLDEKTFELLILDLLEGVRKDGMELKPAIIDIEFSGNLNNLFLLLRFVLEVNFKDFFSDRGIFKTLLN